jgi:hypothetical protein
MKAEAQDFTKQAAFTNARCCYALNGLYQRCSLSHALVEGIE